MNTRIQKANKHILSSKDYKMNKGYKNSGRYIQNRQNKDYTSPSQKGCSRNNYYNRSNCKDRCTDKKNKGCIQNQDSMIMAYGKQDFQFPF